MLALWGLWRPGASEAQHVRGRVLEAETGKPLAGARVVLHQDDDSLLLGVTGEDGGFVGRAPRAGSYQVVASRLGYRPQRRGPVWLDPAAPVELEFRMVAIPVPLEAVTVQGVVNTRFLQTVGFYERQRADFGHFITRDQIEERRASRPSDLLRAIPGVAIIPDPRAPGKVRVQMRGTHPAQGGACAPRVFLDGLIAIRGESHPPGRPGTAGRGDIEDVFEGDPRTPEPSLDDLINPDQIEAIEIYRSASQVPAQFGGAGIFTRCGVIVVWTRHGR